MTPMGRPSTSPKIVRPSARTSGVQRTASIERPGDMTGRCPSAVVQRAGSRAVRVPTTTAEASVRMLSIVHGARLDPAEIDTQSPDGGGPDPPGGGEAWVGRRLASEVAGVRGPAPEQAERVTATNATVATIAVGTGRRRPIGGSPKEVGRPLTPGLARKGPGQSPYPPAAPWGG